MQVTRVPYSKTDSFSKTVNDYLDSVQDLKQFHNYAVDLKEVSKVIADLQQNFKIDRKLLAKSVNQQYESYTPHLKVVKNINNLADEKTFTVTTAHQLNLFGGPLYYIYKILNVIRISDDLNKIYPNFNFVPCYWMGSEDHDFEEINHTYLYNKKIEWNNYQKGSLGEYDTQGISELIPAVKEIIKRGEHLEELMALLYRSYASTKLADAVRIFLDELFGRFGLVVIDGNCAQLKTPFAKIIKDELINQTSQKLVDQQINQLEQFGYKSQATPRPVNLFYKTKNNRERIVPKDEGFELADTNTTIKKDTLIDEINELPERFSPNVILRPLHQQLILPNIAYIGGGSEIAYWLQFNSLFDYYKVHFPMLILRTSAQILNPSQIKKTNKLGIHLTDIFKDANELKKEYVKSKSETDLSLNAEIETVQSLFESLKEKAKIIDGSLGGFIGAEGQKAHKSLENISKRLIKVEKQKNEQDLAQIDKLKDQLFPSGKLQERRENFMPLYAQYGPKLFDQLLEILNPFEQQFYLINTD